MKIPNVIKTALLVAFSFIIIFGFMELDKSLANNTPLYIFLIGLGILGIVDSVREHNKQTPKEQEQKKIFYVAFQVTVSFIITILICTLLA